MSRASEILEVLESRRSTAAEELAALLGVSRRTVTTELSNLQNLLGNAASVIHDSGRYRLLIADPPRYRDLRAHLHLDVSLNEPNSRVSYILARLFRALGPVTIEELSREMSVGRTTVVQDLGRIRQTLADSGLAVEGRPNVGLQLVGDELRQRLHILRYHFPAAYGNDDALAEVEEVVAQFVAREGLDPSQAPELARWTHIALDRSGRGWPIGRITQTHPELASTPAHALATRLADALPGPPLSEEERIFLALPIAGMRTPATKGLADALSAEHEMTTLLDEVLETIRAEMDIDLRGSSFMRDFARHLAYMVNRMKYQIWVDDSGVASIGEEFPVAHRMAEVAIRVIEHTTGLPVDTSELGFLAAYFQVFLEAADRHPRSPLKVTIVAGTGRVTAELIRLQLTHLLPPGTQYRILPQQEALPEQLDSQDLVVLTGTHSPQCRAPFLRVRHVLDRKSLRRDLERLHLRLPGRVRETEFGVLASALDEQHFFAMPAGTSYDDALDYMTGHLEARHLAEPGFGDRIRDRELHSPTRLDPSIGFPHVNLEHDSEVLLALGVIPQQAEATGVRLIVLLGVPDDPSLSESILIPLYDSVLRLGSRPELLQQLCLATTFEEFYYLLASNPLTES